jgi:peptide/nickel transport system permease protein
MIPTPSPPTSPVVTGARPVLPPGTEWKVREGYRRRLQRRFGRNWSLLAGLILLLLFGVLAIVAVELYGSGLDTMSRNLSFALLLDPPGPSWAAPFGIAPHLGVNVASGLLQATPFDLLLVLGPISIAALIGMFLGAEAALGSARSDLVVTTASDMLASVPPFFLVLVLYLGLVRFVPIPDGLLLFGLAFAAILWPYHARPVRARAREVVTTSYFEAARASGAPRHRLLLRHVIPNSLVPVFSQIPVDVFNIFFVLTVFPYLACSGSFFANLSPLPSQTFPEWGFLLAQGVCYGWSPVSGSNFWWSYAFPLATILLFGLAITLLCDGVNRYLRVPGWSVR